jgi:cyanophycinase
VSHSALPAVPAGVLVVIGGAEDKLGRRTVLSRFADLAGGTSARIVVVPTASSLGSELFELYASVFTALGVAEVAQVRPRSREDAEDPATWSALQRATGVFMTGGNQLKLSAVVAGTAFERAMHAAYARGVVVGGTSAGASVVSEHMVALGSGGATPKHRMSQLAAGLGLLRGVVIDQHFDQRNRYGRLLSLVAQSPSLLGLGIDEDTAAIVHGGRVLEVAGRGAVFVVDGSRSVSNAHEAKRTAPLLVSGAVVHTLPAGARFDLAERRLIDASDVEADPAITAAAEEDVPPRRAARADAGPPRSQRHRKPPAGTGPARNGNDGP